MRRFALPPLPDSAQARSKFEHRHLYTGRCAKPLTPWCTTLSDPRTLWHQVCPGL